METNQKSSKSNGVCGKLFRAVNPFSRKRRISHHQQPAASNLLSTTPKPPPQKTFHVQPTKPVMHPHKPAASIPINFDFSSHPEHGNMQTSNAHVGKAEPPQQPRGNKKEDIPRTVSGMNEKFSAYIDGVKNKLKIASDSESEVLDENGKKSHLDDRVDEFIHNARIKLRTTSSSVGTADHSFS